MALQLQQIPTVFVDPDLVETNIVIFEVVQSEHSTQELLQAFKEVGVLLNIVGDRTFRAVTHLDVGVDEIARVATMLSSILAS